MYYHTQGPVRGSCCHNHRSIRTACACLRSDQRGCAAQGGYSDRAVVRADGEPMSEAELEALDLVDPEGPRDPSSQGQVKHDFGQILQLDSKHAKQLSAKTPSTCYLEEKAQKGNRK